MTWEGTQVLQLGQYPVCLRFTLWCDRLLPDRELECFRFGTAIVLILKYHNEQIAAAHRLLASEHKTFLRDHHSTKSIGALDRESAAK